MVSVSSFTSQDWLRFQAGDEAAYEKLYQHFFDALYNYGYRFTRDNTLIEDAIHDLFLRLWKNRKTLKRPPDIKNYIYKAFRHAMIDKLSQRARTSAIDTHDLPAFTLEITREVEMMQKEQAEALRHKINAILARLTPHQREAIFLRYYENLSYPEIADMLNLTQKATYKLVGRAIAALRKIIPEQLIRLVLLFACLK